MLCCVLELQRSPENGNVLNEEIKKALPKPQVPETEEKPQKFLNEKQQVGGFENYEKDATFFLWPLERCILINIKNDLFAVVYVFYFISWSVSYELHSMTFFFLGAGEPGAANKVYFTGFRILWGQASCCLSDIQMPSPLEVI